MHYMVQEITRGEVNPVTTFLIMQSTKEERPLENDALAWLIAVVTEFKTLEDAYAEIDRIIDKRKFQVKYHTYPRIVK